MKKIKAVAALLLALSLLLSGCGASENGAETHPEPDAYTENELPAEIVLSDEGITMNGETLNEEDFRAVYVANDIVYYPEGKDFTFGEGTAEDAHSQEEADSHTVLHITHPGTYRLTGKLSAGQIAVDLGEDSVDSPDCTVTLILDNVDITCTVAPAIIFYNVYECGSSDTETATHEVDTTAAGANVIIADDSVNHVSGSYVARIYKSVELSEDGTEVIDSKKLHKYDAAFYSKMTMNISGGEKGTGILNITAENEGLDSELHLTINGGNININAGNDGINTNEDGVSVTTINGGSLNIVVNGATGEGDGIDSNGWLVINGGTVTASACSFSGDAGIDSDMGIYLNGGTVVAGGNMLDRLEEGGQNHAVFTFRQGLKGGTTVTLKASDESVTGEWTLENDCSILVVSSPELTAGTYTLWQGETLLAVASGSNMGGFGGSMHPEDFDGEMIMPEGGFKGEMPLPDGEEIPIDPEGMELPESGFDGAVSPELPADERPEGIEPPEGFEPPEGTERPDRGKDGGRDGMGFAGEESTELIIIDGANYFTVL